MNLKGQYKLEYTIDKEPNRIILNVELKEIEGFKKPRQNVWEGFAVLDKKPYTDVDLSNCVDAKLAAQSIGYKLRNEIKQEARKNQKLFRIKKEEIT